MSLRTYQLTLAATQQRLSDAYGTSAKFPAGSADPALDIPYRQVTLQAEAAAAYVGMDATVATNKYGNKIAIDGSVTYGPFPSGPVHLSDFYVLGAGSTLHVSAIPF